MASIKADSRLAEFLRRVRADDDGVAPVEAIFGEDATNEVQQSVAQQFASSIRDMGYIESASGDGDLHRVRVTQQGRDWLDDHDRNRPTLHPRYSS